MNLIHEVRTEADRNCLVLHGEIDLVVREELHAILQHMVGMSHTTEVDLRDVTFLDCAGIGVLVAANNIARRKGHYVIVSHPCGIARRVLELTGVLAYLTAPSPRPAALRGLLRLRWRRPTPEAAAAQTKALST